MKKQALFVGLLLVCTSLLVGIVVVPGATRMAAQTPAIDASKARQYFAEAKALSERDNGTLWKVPLCGPLLFVDYSARYAVANQADTEGKLKPFDGVFAGTAPPELGVANTAMKWAGVEWTMVIWPLPESWMCKTGTWIRSRGAFGCKWNGARSSMHSGSRAKNAGATWQMRFIFETIAARFSPRRRSMKMRWK